MSKSEFQSDRSQWMKPALALVIFLAAFLPRAIYPVSRPAQWYTRSVMFMHSVQRGAWEETVYSEHPGVTTMWLSGVALRLAGVTPEQRSEGPYVDPDSLTARESAIGVLPLALAISLCIVLSYLLLARLFNHTAALSAALLMALDPFFIANSKVLHVDGVLAATMCTSALALLVFVRERQMRWVVLSGALAGLALLTKSPALFLVPYAVLCLGVGFITDRAMDWRRALLAGLIWLVTLACVYGALFPAMWVAPVDTLKAVYKQAALRISWAHPNPIYFRGRAFIGDPGPMYYICTWGYKVTSVVSVFALVSLTYAMFAKELSRNRWVVVGLIFAFVFFFTLQMMLGAKKMPRYLLPAFPLVDVLAGLGLAWWAKRVSDLRSPISNFQFRTSNALISSGLLLQAVLVLPRHPYYDTYFNELAGGARAGVSTISTQWQGEGLDIAARTLNKVPGAEDHTVGSHKDAFFSQYFAGRTVDADEPADWYVFGVNNVLRGGDEEEDKVVDFYRRRRAWDTVAFGAIPYVWIYPAATGPQNSVTFTFQCEGAGIQLIGYDIVPPPLHPGQTLRLQLYWQAMEPVAEDYTVFVHMLSVDDGADQLVVQQDNPPVRGAQPTSTWKPGAVIVDPYDLSIPRDTPPGEYTLAVGLYHWPDLARLPVRDDEDTRLPDDRLLLTTVRVEPKPPSPAVWIAWALVLSLLLSVGVDLGRHRFASLHTERRRFRPPPTVCSRRGRPSLPVERGGG